MSTVRLRLLAAVALALAFVPAAHAASTPTTTPVAPGTLEASRSAGRASAASPTTLPAPVFDSKGRLVQTPLVPPEQTGKLSKAQALRHLIGRKSDRVTIDRAGRICLPEAMARAAGIEDEAILVGLVDRFEIWNPARYEAASAVDDQLMSEAFQLI